MSAKSIHVLTLGITPIERQLPPGQPDLWTLAACDRQTTTAARHRFAGARGRSRRSVAYPVSWAVLAAMCLRRKRIGYRYEEAAAATPSCRRGASDRRSGSQARHWSETAASDHQRATDRDERKESGLSGCLLQSIGPRALAARRAPAAVRVPWWPILARWPKMATHKRRLRRGRASARPGGHGHDAEQGASGSETPPMWRSGPSATVVILAGTMVRLPLAGIIRNPKPGLPVLLVTGYS